jgi:hypothetical protein
VSAPVRYVKNRAVSAPVRYTHSLQYTANSVIQYYLNIYRIEQVMILDLSRN